MTPHQRLLSPNAFDVLDTEGRPLLEQASAFDEGVEVPCPYNDVRHGRPMNRCALDQISRYWEAILDKIGAGSKATVLEAFGIALTVTATPLLEPPDSPSPRSAAFYKAMVGFSQALFGLVLEGAGPLPLEQLGDEDEFLEWLHSRGLLVGQSQVCAGSPAMIGQLFRALCTAAGEVNVGLLEAVALQAALAISTYDALDRQGTPVEGHVGWALLQGRGWPWMLAVTWNPHRDPVLVRTLFPNGGAPRLDAFLGKRPRLLTHEDRLVAFREEYESLDLRP